MSPVSSRLSDEALFIITEQFSPLEVKEAIFQMHSAKAPGPEGFFALFLSEMLELYWARNYSDYIENTE